MSEKQAEVAELPKQITLGADDIERLLRPKYRTRVELLDHAVKLLAGDIEEQAIDVEMVQSELRSANVRLRALSRTQSILKQRLRRARKKEEKGLSDVD